MPLRLQRADRVGKNGSARRVQRTDAREAKNDDANVADLGDLEQESVCGTEEERPLEPVGDDVLVEQRLLLLGVVAGIDRGLVDDDRKGHLSQGIEPCNDHPQPRQP